MHYYARSVIQVYTQIEQFAFKIIIWTNGYVGEHTKPFWKHLLHIGFFLAPATPQVYRIWWWMRHYSAGSAKRHVGLTNNAYCDKFNLGRLTRAQRESCTTKTTKKTVNKSTGRVGYQGTSQLKGTQFLGHMLSPFFLRCKDRSHKYIYIKVL